MQPNTDIDVILTNSVPIPWQQNTRRQLEDGNTEFFLEGPVSHPSARRVDLKIYVSSVIIRHIRDTFVWLLTISIKVLLALE